MIFSKADFKVGKDVGKGWHTQISNLWMIFFLNLVNKKTYHQSTDNISDGLVLLDEAVEIIHQDGVLIRHLFRG
jgi:hypothetical protein